MSSLDCKSSTFLNRSEITWSGSLATLYLRRDLSVPVILQRENAGDDGYEEGVVTNTRFGSFPHNTLTGAAWGAQVRASLVDTGSRGRKGSQNAKRKREPEASDAQARAAASASSGFAHLLPPTVESWCSSLPHRTQVVYTPDYSYILQRLRVRPGSVVIEAGAGSGAFTHAAARAAYGRNGKVWSFEFHEQRAQRLSLELRDHGLDGLTQVRHRDVYDEGFAVSPDLHADAIFLDLPAPWLALKHLTRSGPLKPQAPARICTFSPCIEQVQRTVQEFREHGWLEIEMVEIGAKRIEVRREQVGGLQENAKGISTSPTSVDEALGRLREIERRAELFHGEGLEAPEMMTTNSHIQEPPRHTVAEGPLFHRPEPELKAHTSYLVFAVLPVQPDPAHTVRADLRGKVSR